MGEMLVIRHGQASFGAGDAADYDNLSEQGSRQSELAGAALRAAGWVPDRLVTGTLRRQKETLAAMGFGDDPETHAGLNEYDFYDLLQTRFDGKVPDQVRRDRKTHFRTLREVIYDWQAGGLDGARESWLAFVARVEAARAFAAGGDARRVLVVSSGGVIGQMVAAALDAPARQMVALNLQIKNTSMTRFIFSGDRFTLNEFNATPHFADQTNAAFMTYS